MIYPSDFKLNLDESDVITHGKSTFVSLIKNPQNNVKDKIQTKEVHHSNVIIPVESIWVRYCNNSTVHGIRYLTNTEIHYTER